MRRFWLGLLALVCLGVAPWWESSVCGAPRQKEDEYDRIVNEFIAYDIGQLPGPAGQMANQRFRSLQTTDAIPALVRGVNRTARIPASCPIIMLSQKLQELLRSADRDMLRYVSANLDRGANLRYGQFLENLRQSVNVQMGQAAATSPTVLRDMRAVTASQLRRSRVPVDKWSYDDLVEAVSQEKGEALVQVLEELQQRKGSQYTEALANAIPQVSDDVKPAARGLLAQRLVRMTDETLKAKLSDPNEEVRAAAAVAVGYKGSPLYKELAVAVRDKSSLVATNAHDVLVKMLGEDRGPPAGADGMQWYQASKAWEEWLQKRDQK